MKQKMLLTKTMTHLKDFLMVFLASQLSFTALHTRNIFTLSSNITRQARNLDANKKYGHPNKNSIFNHHGENNKSKN